MDDFLPPLVVGRSRNRAGAAVGLGSAQAVAEATGRSIAAIKADMVTEGDLGTIATQSRGKQATLGFARKPKPLTVRPRLVVAHSASTSFNRQPNCAAVGCAGHPYSYARLPCHRTVLGSAFPLPSAIQSPQPRALARADGIGASRMPSAPVEDVFRRG